MKTTAALFTLALLGTAPLLAQNATRTDAALRQIQSRAAQPWAAKKLTTSVADAEAIPELYPGENADVGPQYIMLERAARRHWVEGGFDAQYFYTSNLFFTEKGNVDTGTLLLSAYAAFAPEPLPFLGGQLALRAGYRHQRYMYSLGDTGSQLNNFDFDVATLFLSGRWEFRPGWAAYIGADYNRLLGHEENWNEFYIEFVPQWGLERQFQFGENHAVTLAYLGAHHQTHTNPAPSNINDRLDTALALAWTWQVLPRVYLQPFYRWQHVHYWTNSDRNDHLNTFGITATWQINDWAALRAFASYEVRTSNDPEVQDYHKWDGGGGISLGIRF